MPRNLQRIELCERSNKESELKRNCYCLRRRRLAFKLMRNRCLDAVAAAVLAMQR